MSLSFNLCVYSKTSIRCGCSYQL